MWGKELVRNWLGKLERSHWGRRGSLLAGEGRVGGSILFNSATLCKHPFVTGAMLRSGQKQLFPQ